MRSTQKSRLLLNRWSGTYTYLCLPACLHVHLVYLFALLPLCLLNSSVLSFSLPVCLSFCLSSIYCLSGCCQPVCPPVCQLMYWSICPSICCLLSLYLLLLFLFLFSRLSVSLNACIYPPAHLSVHSVIPLYLTRCRRPKGQQPSVVLMWDRLLLVAGVCNDTIQYPLRSD